MRKIYMDMEFYPRKIKTSEGEFDIYELISIGMVDEHGESYYAVCNEFNQVAAKQNIFIRDVVLPRLHKHENEWKSKAQIREDIRDFLDTDEKNLIHYWYIPHDFLLFTELVREKAYFYSLPDNVEKIGIDVAQDWLQAGKPDILPKIDKNKEHNALVDAKWLKKADEAILRFKP